MSSSDTDIVDPPTPEEVEGGSVHAPGADASMAVLKEANELARVMRMACTLDVGTCDRAVAAESLVAAVTSYLRDTLATPEDFFKQPQVARAVMAMRDEGLVGHRLSGKAQLIFEIKKIITSMSKCLSGPGFAPRYARWAVQPIGDMLARSASMDASGGSAPAVVFQIPLDNLNTKLRCRWMDCETHTVNASERDSGVKQHKSGDDEIHVVFDPIEFMISRAPYIYGGQRDQAEQIWEKGIADADVKIATNNVVCPLEDGDHKDAVKAIYAGAMSDPANAITWMFPLMSDDDHMVAGHVFNGPDMIANAYLELCHRLFVDKWHPAAVVNWLLFDCIDYRVKGVALSMAATNDCTAGISEHTAVKVQRLGSRLIHIQCALSRIMQDLKSHLEEDLHPCAVTCASGEAVGKLLKQMSIHSPTATCAVQEEGRAGQTNGPPVLSLSSFIPADAPELDTVRAMMPALDVLHTVLHMSMAKGHVDAERASSGVTSLQARVIERGVVTRRDGSRQNTGSLNAAEHLHLTCMAEALAPEGHVRSSKCELMLNGTLKHMLRMADNRPEGAAVCFAEFDTKKFTPGCTAAMFQANVHYMDFRQPGTNGWADFALSTIGYSQSSRVVLTCSDRLMHQDRPLVPKAGLLVSGRHNDCRCLDFALHASLHSHTANQAVGADRSLYSMCNGNVSQGFNVNESTMYGILAYSGAHAGSKALINGDDQLRSRASVLCANQWRRLWSDEQVPPADLKAGAPLDIMSVVCNAISLAVHHFVDAVSGAQANSKNALVPCADPGSGGTITFAGVVSGTGLVMKTQDGSYQDIASEIQEASYPAFLAHCLRHLRKSQCTEALSDEHMARVVDHVRNGLPNLGASWVSTMNNRLHKQREGVLEGDPEFVDYCSKWTGSPVSIWSGHDGVLDMGIEPLVSELGRVIRDPMAPQFAKEYAKAGMLILPKGRPAHTLNRDMDGFGGANKSITNVSVLETNARKYPMLGAGLKLRVKQATVQLATWVSQRYAAHIPLLGQEHYASETAIDLRCVADPRSVTLRKLVTCRGDAVPGIPRVSINSVVLRPWAGGSRYQADMSAYAAGVIDTIKSVVPGGRTMVCMMATAIAQDTNSALSGNLVPLGGTFSRSVAPIQFKFGPNLEFESASPEHPIRGRIVPIKSNQGRAAGAEFSADWYSFSNAENPASDEVMEKFTSYVTMMLGRQVTRFKRAIQGTSQLINGELVTAGDPLRRFGFTQLRYIGWGVEPNRTQRMVSLRMRAVREVAASISTSTWEIPSLLDTEYSIDWAVVSPLPSIANATCVSCTSNMSTGDLHAQGAKSPSLNALINGPSFNISYVPGELAALDRVMGDEPTLMRAGFVFLHATSMRYHEPVNQVVDGRWTIRGVDSSGTEVVLLESGGRQGLVATAPDATGPAEVMRFHSLTTLIGALVMLMVNHQRTAQAHRLQPSQVR